jgi:hypothetical protein
LTAGLYQGILIGFVFAGAGGLWKGGCTCFQHDFIRLLLWQTGSLPWNAVRFLDYAAERIFLQKPGVGISSLIPSLWSTCAHHPWKQPTESWNAEGVSYLAIPFPKMSRDTPGGTQEIGITCQSEQSDTGDEKRETDATAHAQLLSIPCGRQRAAMVPGGRADQRRQECPGLEQLDTGSIRNSSRRKENKEQKLIHGRGATAPGSCAKGEKDPEPEAASG